MIHKWQSFTEFDDCHIRETASRLAVNEQQKNQSKLVNKQK